MAKSAGQIGSMVGFVIAAAIATYVTWGAATPYIVAQASAWGAIGGMVGGLAGTLYDTATADDQVRDQGRLADLSLQTSTFGMVIPQIFGGYGGIAGNVIWSTPKDEHQQRHEASSGKGGGPKQVTITRTYTMSLAIGICDTRLSGPVAFLRTIYRDLTPIWYGAPGKPLPDGWTLYNGSPDQMPDPTMEAALGVGNVPAYRYLCYVVIKDDDLGFSGRTFNYTFDVGTDAATSLAYGALKVQPETGIPWLNVRHANDIWSLDPETQAITIRTHLDGPEVTGIYPGTTDAQLAVGTERVWATAGAWFFELDSATGAILSSYQAETHQVDQVTFPDVFVSSVVERGDAGIAMVQCSAPFVAWEPGYETILVRLGRGGSLTTRTLSQRRPVWMEPAPDGTLWAMAGRYVVAGPPTGGMQEQYLYHLDPGSLASFSETVVGMNVIQSFHVAPDGRVWVPVYWDARVRRFSSSGAYEAEQTLAAWPIQCTSASDGAVWVLCQANPPEPATEPGHLFRLEANSLEILQHVRVDPTSLGFGPMFASVHAGDMQICPGPDGSVWVLSRLQHTLSHVSATGTLRTFRTGYGPITVQPALDPHEVWVSCLQGGAERFNLQGRIPASQVASTSGTLAGVVQALCGAVGLTPDRLDLTQCPPGNVEMALVSMQAARAPLEDLARAYRFYVVESGFQLAFRSIGTGDMIAAIPESAMDASEEAPKGQGLLITRLDDQQLPNSLDVTYADPVQRYQSNTQRHMLATESLAVEAPRTVNVNVALPDTVAKQLSQELLSSMLVQRETFRTQLSREYAYLEPGDRVTLTARGLTYPVVVLQTSYGRPGLLDLQAVQDAAYVRDAVGAAPPVVHPAPPVIATVPPTVVLLLNLPALHGADTTPRAHAAFVAGGPSWDGAVLYRSSDGETYTSLLSSSLEAWTGTVPAATPAADWHVLDTTTVIRVHMRGTAMQLQSISDDALYAGGNRCVLGPEILAFGQATLVGALTYDLSRLLRGLRGTEHRINTHVPNETFLILDQAVMAYPLLLGDVQSPRYYKAVSVGATIDLVEPITFIGTAANMYPWDVAQPEAVRQGDGSWLITWRMRSRFAPEWMQRTGGIPVDYDFRSFRVDIYTASGFTTVARSTLTDGGNPLDGEALKQWTYSVAEQTTDFGAPITTLYYRVVQLTNYGPGYAYSLTAT